MTSVSQYCASDVYFKITYLASVLKDAKNYTISPQQKPSTKNQTNKIEIVCMCLGEQSHNKIKNINYLTKLSKS